MPLLPKQNLLFVVTLSILFEFQDDHHFSALNPPKLAIILIIVFKLGGIFGGGLRCITLYTACHSSSSNIAIHGISGQLLPNIVMDKIRHEIIMYKLRQGFNLSAVCNCHSSTLQPLLSTLKKISICQRQLQ